MSFVRPNRPENREFALRPARNTALTAAPKA
jgi:hypothetical protein